MSQLGTGIYRSEDGGDSWEYLNRYNNRPFYYSHIWISPHDDNIVYVLAGSAQISVDGGRTFERNMQGISGDFDFELQTIDSKTFTELAVHLRVASDAVLKTANHMGALGSNDPSGAADPAWDGTIDSMVAISTHYEPLTPSSNY